jgi:hypothetical protein
MNTSQCRIDELFDRWDFDGDLMLDGRLYGVKFKFEKESKPVDHRHNRRTGQGQDLYAEVPLGITAFDVVDENDVSVHDQKIVQRLADKAKEELSA